MHIPNFPIIDILFMSALRTHQIKQISYNSLIMANDAALRTSLVWLGAVMVMVWLYTKSFKKMAVTYVVGLLGIAGVLLPDWDFFDRDYSRWLSPVTEEEKTALAQRSGLMNRIPPLRLVAYTTIYGYALYKWWMFVSN